MPNTGHANPSLTLTEAQLFAEYAAGTVKFKAYGRERDSDVADLFNAFGEVDYFTDASLAGFEDILHQDEPEIALTAMRDTIEGMLLDINIALVGFQELQSARLIRNKNSEAPRYTLKELTVEEAE